MAWTAEKVRALRESNPSETAKKDEESGKWTAERVRALRTSSPGRGAKGVAAAEGTDLYSTALEDYRTRNNLGFADAMDSRSDELNRQKATVSPAGNTLGTWYGQQAQKLKNSYAEYSQPDDFDQANQWFDQPRNQELVNKLLEKKSNYTSYAETGTSRNGASAGDGSIDPFRTTGIKGKVGNTYSTADLKKLGYTDTEIRQAREYLDTMEEIPEWKQLARRTANTVGGVADTVAAAPLMGAEYLVQAGKNIRQSSENRKALEAELARNPREKNLYDQLMETDMDYQPKYSTGDLLQQGFTRQEIEDMRSRIAGTEAKGDIDTEKSVGYQLYNRGQQLTGAAQSGLTDVQRSVQGVATSAAENLAVAAINPAAVLPVLSAQGAADAMGKSARPRAKAQARRWWAAWPSLAQDGPSTAWVRLIWQEPWARTTPEIPWRELWQTRSGRWLGIRPLRRHIRQLPTPFPAALTTPCRPLWRPTPTRPLMRPWETAKLPRPCLPRTRWFRRWKRG